jgi:ATP-binding cassette subfamily F protein 3
MSLLSLGDVTVAFGPHDIFAGVTCEVNPGDRIGLVGRNGVGKSTLLRVLAGDLLPNEGRRSLARGQRTALVEQVLTPADEATRLVDEARSALRDVLDLHGVLEHAADNLAAGDGHAHRFDRALNHLDVQDGFNYQNRLEQVLTGVGFSPTDWETPVAFLSGGQRGRLALAKGLLARPDVLLMDEPTNHLDIAALEWLEAFLKRWRGALVVTSHDRVFLDVVANQIWHLDGGSLTSYRGNYTAFEHQHAAAVADQQRRFEAQRAEIEKQEAFIRRYGAGQRAGEARGRAKRLARVERMVAPEEQGQVKLKFGAERSGDVALTLRGLRAGYGGSTLVQADDLVLERGARVALVGPNGAGKTTLLKTLTGELDPVAGAAVWGSNVRLSLYQQEAENLDPQATVLDVVRSNGLDDQEARNLLGRFLFSGDDAEKRVAQLSGGERGRLAIARMSLSGANALLLDEPTNHLDIPNRASLEAALAAFPGTLVFASHDRRLIRALASRIWLVQHGRVRELDGGLDEYEAALRPVVEPRSTNPAERADAERNREAAIARKRAREVAALEDRIGSLESELARLSGELELAGTRSDLVAITDLGERFARGQHELERLMHEWVEKAE